jgi:A/G-specific adenine glycosylase
VVSRVFDEKADPATAKGRRRFAHLAAKLLDILNPGAFNQAMMELGATICLPKNPQCLVCPVATLCSARAAGTQQQLPTKAAKRKNVEELRRAFWIEDKGRLLAWQRPAKSRLMPGFWELPEPLHLPHVEPGEKLGSFRHGITVHNYRFEIYWAAPPTLFGECQWLTLANLEDSPLSTTFKKARRLRENLKSLPHVLRSTAAASG